MDDILNKMIKCYENDQDFKQYVDKCVRTYGRDVDYVLHQPITQQYYLYLTKQGEYKNE